METMTALRIHRICMIIGLVDCKYISVPNVDARLKRIRDVLTCIVQYVIISGVGPVDWIQEVVFTMWLEVACIAA